MRDFHLTVQLPDARPPSPEVLIVVRATLNGVEQPLPDRRQAQGVRHSRLAPLISRRRPACHRTRANPRLSRPSISAWQKNRTGRTSRRRLTFRPVVALTADRGRDRSSRWCRHRLQRVPRRAVRSVVWRSERRWAGYPALVGFGREPGRALRARPGEPEHSKGRTPVGVDSVINHSLIPVVESRLVSFAAAGYIDGVPMRIPFRERSDRRCSCAPTPSVRWTGCPGNYSTP